jgi:hypothetical protein
MSSFSRRGRSAAAALLLTLSLAEPNVLSAQIGGIGAGTSLTPTSGWVNPARLPNANGYLVMPGLGGLSISAFHTGPRHGAVVSDEGLINIDGLLDGLDPLEHVVTDVVVPILGFGFRAGPRWAFHYSSSARVEQRTSYPRDLLTLAWRGNAHPDLIGTRISLDGLGIYAQAYVDHALSASVELPKHNVRIGMGAHYLMGLGAVNTLTSRVGWETDPLDYAWTFDGALDVRAAGIPVDLNTLDSIGLDAFSSPAPMETPIASGASIDLGLIWNPAPEWQIEAAATGLGSIRWDNLATAVRLDPQSFRFDGIDLLEALSAENDSAGTGSSATEEMLDSLANSWTPDWGGDATFTSSPMRRLYVSARYAPVERFAATVFLARKTAWDAHFYSAGIGAEYRFGNVLSLHVLGQSFDAEQWLLGGGFSLRAGPVRWSLSTSNALPLLAYYDHNTLNFSTSVNFEFGWRKQGDDSRKKNGSGSSSKRRRNGGTSNTGGNL